MKADNLKNEIYNIITDVIEEYYNSPNANFNHKNLYYYDNWKDVVINKIIVLLHTRGLLNEI